MHTRIPLMDIVTSPGPWLLEIDDSSWGILVGWPINPMNMFSMKDFCHGSSWSWQKCQPQSRPCRLHKQDLRSKDVKKYKESKIWWVCVTCHIDLCRKQDSVCLCMSTWRGSTKTEGLYFLCFDGQISWSGSQTVVKRTSSNYKRLLMHDIHIWVQVESMIFTNWVRRIHVWWIRSEAHNNC